MFKAYYASSEHDPSTKRSRHCQWCHQNMSPTIFLREFASKRIKRPALFRRLGAWDCYTSGLPNPRCPPFTEKMTWQFTMRRKSQVEMMFKTHFGGFSILWKGPMLHELPRQLRTGASLYPCWAMLGTDGCCHRGPWADCHLSRGWHQSGSRLALRPQGALGHPKTSSGASHPRNVPWNCRVYGGLFRVTYRRSLFQEWTLAPVRSEISEAGHERFLCLTLPFPGGIDDGFPQGLEGAADWDWEILCTLW